MCFPKKLISIIFGLTLRGCTLALIPKLKVQEKFPTPTSFKKLLWFGDPFPLKFLCPLEEKGKDE